MDIEEGHIYAPLDPNIIYRLFGYDDDKGITLLIKWIYLIKKHPELIRNIKQLMSTSPETINVQTDKGYTALHIASRSGNKEIVELLLEHDMSSIASDQTHKCCADPNLLTKKGYTALYWASRRCYPSRRSHMEILKLLLEHGVDPNLQDNDGETSLHWASRCSRKERVNLLLEHDADPNLQSKKGETSLHEASRSGKKEIVELLLEHDVDPNLQNKKGETSLHLASHGNYKKIIKLLEEAHITYPIKKAHEQSIFTEKVNFMKKYANMEIILVNNRLHNYICL